MDFGRGRGLGVKAGCQLPTCRDLTRAGYVSRAPFPRVDSEDAAGGAGRARSLADPCAQDVAGAAAVWWLLSLPRVVLFLFFFTK